MTAEPIKGPITIGIIIKKIIRTPEKTPTCVLGTKSLPMAFKTTMATKYDPMVITPKINVNIKESVKLSFKVIPSI